MPYRDSIHVTTKPSGDLLVSKNGSPVWPLRTSEEERALRNLATYLGLDLLETEGFEGAVSAQAGTVVALGSDAHAEARLYAHLTGRHVKCLDDSYSLEEVLPVEVIFTTPRHVTSPLLDHLYKSDLETAPGIIYANTREEMRLQALLRSVAGLSGAPIKPERVDFCPMLSVKSNTFSDRLLLDREAGAEKIEETLRDGAEILNIFAHSDGIDANFGPLVLCPMDRHPLGGSPASRPTCAVTDVCFRLKMPVESAIASGRLLYPEQLSARILILRICHGLTVAPSIVDEVWSLVSRLHRSVSVGALVTAWGSFQSSYGETEVFLKQLQQGATVGAALAQHNRSAKIRETGQELCLLGDPSTRLSFDDDRGPTESAPAAKSSVSFGRPRPEADPEAELGEAAFLRACVIQQNAVHKGEVQELTDAAVSSINEYERAVWRGARVENSNGYGQRMRVAVLEALCAQGSSLYRYWEEFSLRRQVIPSNRKCLACHQVAALYSTPLRIPSVAPRRTLFCQRCGVIEEAPFEAPQFSLSTDDRKVALTGDIPQSQWSGALVLDPKAVAGRITLSWPVAPEGAAAMVVAIPGGLPAGHYFAAGMFIVRASLIIVRAPFYEAGM